MTEEPTKASHWKGQSRVQKCCHWCTKKQESKPFQACSRCKEVIYCSKACQVASWPHHKTACNFNSKNKEALAGASASAANSVAVFKKWHGSHIPALRHAAICALDLGNKPSNLDDGVLFVEVMLKADHEKLPPSQKYEPVNGCTFTMAETLEMIGPRGGASILESVKSNTVFMRAKGGLGVAIIMLQAHGFCDIVKVALSSPAAAKIAQQSDNWGENWVEGLRRATSL